MTSLFRLQPCLLSIFDKIYRFCRLEVQTRIPLWPSVRKEILLACNTCWLARVDMKSPLIHQVDAGDSADHGYAMMTSTCRELEIRRALRFREKWRYIPLPDDVKDALTHEDHIRLTELLRQKAGMAISSDLVEHAGDACSLGGVGLDTEYGQWIQQVLADGDWLKTLAIASQRRARKRNRADIDFPALVEPIADELLRPHRFKLLWAKRWRDSGQHINIKEAMVALSSLKRTARVASLCHSTKLTLSDNLASVLCFEKGRSSSPSLNRLCRISAAFQTSLGINWRLRHIESCRNTADEPSRWFEQNRPPEIKWIEMKRLKSKPHLELVKYISTTPAKDLVNNRSPPGLTAIQDNDQPEDAEPADCHSIGSPCLGNAICKEGKLDRKCGKATMLEVFSGSGHLSQACESQGIRVVGQMDILHGHQFDLTRRSTQQFLIKFLASGTISYCHFGTPCTVFSAARKGIRNFTRARLKERISCELAFFTIKLIEICLALGISWSIENPLTSALWELFPFKKLLMRNDVYIVEFPMCAYGTPYKKMTRVVTNIVELCSLQRTCIHTKHLVQLVGRDTFVDDSGNRVSMNRTKAAGAYPLPLVEVWASLLSRTLQPCHVEEELETIVERFNSGILQASKRGNSSQFDILDRLCQQIPKLQEHIVFGQDSAAIKAQKRKRKEKAARALNTAWSRL